MNNQIKIQPINQLTQLFAGCRHYVFFAALSALMMFVNCSNDIASNNATPKPLPTGNIETDSPTPLPAPTLAEVQLPQNGYGKFFFKKSNAGSRIKIVPAAGDWDHMIIKLEDWSTEKVICWFLIREGKSFETPIPEGNYRIKIASGKKWYGEQHLFGSDASYSSITDMIEIPASTRYTLSLTPSEGGTIKEESIGAEEF